MALWHPIMNKEGLPRFLAGMGFKQVNQRWSWGASDDERQIVMLFVWTDQILNHDGKRYVEIQRSPEKQIKADDRHGRTEREKHIKLIRSGYTCYLVMQKAKDPKASPREREWYSERLSTAGEIIELENGRRMIEITGKVEADELRPTSLG